MPASAQPSTPRRPRLASATESPYVSVRELYELERRLNEEREKAMKESEARLLAAIEKSNVRHDETHSQMRRIGDERHEPISKHLKEVELDEENELLEKAKRAGIRGVFTGLWRAVIVLDQHWRIVALVLGGILAFLGNIHVSLSGN